MIALDPAARALGRAAALRAPRAFAALAGAELPAAATLIETDGHAATGHGAARYVHDWLATPALLAAHPRACFAAADGRVFRLLGDQQGWITPEQLGCPRSAPGTDQRAFLQAAIDYAVAAGLKGVMLHQRSYELWAPPRSSAFSAHDRHDGNFLVITGRIALASAHPLRTRLHCKGPTGGSLASDYQVLDAPEYGGAVIWRGSGIKIASTVNSGSPAEPDDALPLVTLERLVLFSDAVGTRNTAWPAYPPSRMAGRENCWDVSNKGIHVQQDRQAGIIRARDSDIIGFLGECVYSSALGKGGFVGRNLVMRHSNGQALNPNGPGLFDIDGLIAENCGFAIEGWGGRLNARIVNATFRDCKRGSLSGGWNWAADRREDGTLPLLYLDARFENCTDLHIGAYTHGRLVLVDTQLALIGLTAAHKVHDVDLDVTSICDAAGGMTAVRFGPAAGAPAQSLSDISVRLRCVRSRAAREAARGFNLLFSQSGSLGPDIYLRASGKVRKGGAVYGTMPDFGIAVIEQGLEITERGGASAFDPRTTPAPDLGAFWLRANFGGESGVFAMMLPADLARFNDGAEIIIEHRDDTSKQAVLDVGGLALLAYKDRVKLRADRFHNRWRVAEAPASIAVQTTLSVPATAAGAESGPYAVAHPAARPGARAEVRVMAASPHTVSAVRAEAGQVRFWLRNMDAGAAVPVAALPVSAAIAA